MNDFCKFCSDKSGTPSIETVAIVAFVAIAMFLNLGSLGEAVGSVFDFVSSIITDEIAE